MKITVQNDGELPINVKSNLLRKGQIIEPGDVEIVEVSESIVFVLELEPEELGKLDQSEGA